MLSKIKSRILRSTDTSESFLLTIVSFLFYSKAKNIDLSDLLEDPIVYYQRKYYVPLVVIIWFFIPTFIPYYCWNESLINSMSANVLRYAFMLHCAFMVNSVAHLHSAGYSESKF
jgi:fatty-acid desaturase